MKEHFPTIGEIIKVLEAWAPLETAAGWDNSGLQVGNAHRRVGTGLVALDLVPRVLEEAIQLGATLILSHHPLLFQPLAQITTDALTAGLALRLAEEKIALYSMHTNLDTALDGVSTELALLLGLHDVRCLDPSTEYAGGIGAIGKLPRVIPLEAFLKHAASVLESSTLRFAGHLAMPIGTVAVCGGAGADLIPKALACNADAYLTADLRYHQYFDVLGLDGEARMALIDAGHYETEMHSEELLCRQLGKLFPQVTWHRTSVRSGPVRSFTQTSPTNT